LQFYWLPLPDVLAQLLADASLVEELQFNYQEITKDGQVKSCNSEISENK
jgi:hypothetical protein